MDIETQKSMKLAVVGAGIAFIISIFSNLIMIATPVSSIPDYNGFLRIKIISMMIQFVILPVLLVFFVNDSGELENFTKKGLLEDAWKVNTIGVIVMIIAGALLGVSLASMFLGWDPIPPDRAVIYGPAINLMCWAEFVQRLGFAIPVFYFLMAKSMAKDEIPFEDRELLSDKVGIVFSMLLPISSALLIIDKMITLAAGILGLATMCVGLVWVFLYLIALNKRDIPDIPED
jgi:hypothetical protein